MPAWFAFCCLCHSAANNFHLKATARCSSFQLSRMTSISLWLQSSQKRKKERRITNVQTLHTRTQANNKRLNFFVAQTGTKVMAALTYQLVCCRSLFPVIFNCSLYWITGQPLMTHKHTLASARERGRVRKRQRK